MSKPEVQSPKSKVQSPRVSAARLAAFEILKKIVLEKAFSAILLPAFEENLKPEDRALCHELTLGVLRNQTYLDWHIRHFSGKNPEKLDLAVLLALRLGIYQLKFLSKIPARAAVNESVNLVYLAKKRSAAGFVNAVLRQQERNLSSDLLETIKDDFERLSVETSHPIWLLEKWQKNFGFDETIKLARANNSVPPMAFRITTTAGEDVLKDLAEVGADLTESKIAPNAWCIKRANAKLRELVASGSIYIQDEASQLIAHLADVGANESFLDVCAAPGSKTSLVAQLRAQKVKSPKSKVQSLFVAGDFAAPRIRILRETLEKYGQGEIQIVRYDATRELPFAAAVFDAVLVDAPCSGTGTIRHNPEIRWHLEPRDVAILAEKQLRILTNAAALIKIGGRIVYSTCSLEPEEGEAVIAEFLNNNHDFEMTSINLPEKFLTAEGAARTFPQRDDADGFFVCVLKRKKKNNFLDEQQ